MSPDKKQKRENSSRDETSKIDANRMWESEKSVRANVANGWGSYRFIAVLVDWYSSILVFMYYLISIESMIAIGLSVYLTIYAYDQIENDDSIDGSVMNWVLLSFAVITPMSRSIGMAFSRREMALSHLALIKSTLLNIYSAHACWDWANMEGKTGRDPNFDWLEHCDNVLQASLHLCSDLTRLLTLPRFNRARHRVTSFGKREAQEVELVLSQLHLSIVERMATITDLCEVFKYQGLPPNEATRIRQWERMVAEKIEMLLAIKKYRTPQALRSFARLFTVFLPPFYAPFYGQMAKDLDSLGMAIAFSVLTSLALTSLFESINQIEDPFIGTMSLDGISMGKELNIELRQQLLTCRLHHFSKEAKPFQMEEPLFEIDEA